jgi:amino acid permease
MVFFDSHPGTAGRMELSVAPQWWLFPSITIPLTIIVFIIWLIWRRRRLSALQEVDVRVQPIGASFEDMSSTSSDTEKMRFSP